MTTTIAPALGHGVPFTQAGAGASPGYDAIDLRRATIVGQVQEGVLNSGSYAVTERAAGANMSVDIAASTVDGALVQGDSVTPQGLYTIPPHSAVINETLTAADGTHPRIDQVILEVKDDTHDSGGLNIARTRVLTGTASSGATLTNRTGATALPVNAVRLADILVVASDTAISDSEIRDRRPWARGASWSYQKVDADVSVSGSETSFGSAVQPRLEILSGLFEIGFNAHTTRGAASLWNQIRAFIDGTAILTILQGIYTTNAWAGISGLTIDTIAAGSHTFDFKHRADGGGTIQAGATTEPATFWIREIIEDNAANDATSA